MTRWATQTGARILLLFLLRLCGHRFAASVIRRAEHEIADGDGLETLRAAQARADARRHVAAVLLGADLEHCGR